MSPHRAPVVIVGGGFTGAAVAYHLARMRPKGSGGIVVVEPRGALGAGLAYSTTEPAHRVNVSAKRMSLDTNDGEAFWRWLEAAPDLDADAAASNGSTYPQRALFARYVANCLAPLEADGRIVHVRALAQGIERSPDGTFVVHLPDDAIHAQFVVVATTHPLPAVPFPLRTIADAPGFIANPYDPAALDAILPDQRVLIVGNGLTAADVVAALDRKGHRGPILSVSRHGLRSRAHASVPVDPYGDFVSEPCASALDLLRRVRQTISQARADGLPWQCVLDAVRAQGQDIWRALPEAERRKIVCHLRAFWDVHRFRIAPQVASVLERRTSEGRLHCLAASLVDSRPNTDGLEVTLRRRRSDLVETHGFDVVINTTGPAHRSVVDQPPIRSLFDAELVSLDKVGLGLAATPSGQALDRSGHPVPGLFIAGPLARGALGELMGLPQVTAHAQTVAQVLEEGLARLTRPSDMMRTPAGSRTGCLEASKFPLYTLSDTSAEMQGLMPFAFRASWNQSAS